MPPSKTALSSNPIRRVREKHSKTLQEFSKRCNVSYQLLLLNESGCYPHILPSIMEQLEDLGENPQQLEIDYKWFVLEQRHHFETQHAPYSLPIPGLLHPVESWRESMGYQRTGFAKALCVQPSVLERLEKNRCNELPEQFKEALKEVNLSSRLIEELRERVSDRYYSR